ncbi:hypothetical protein CEV33_1701 [Brucella grignonensis]|uniref:Uncharacterized protein n=1 Tax=Brucella grignonensis TaxID=94627 RepID=A0A256F9W0_9HYPH|nr:hypothetical protein CEV33_1701 [Brucella grignonensis]
MEHPRGKPHTIILVNDAWGKKVFQAFTVVFQEFVKHPDEMLFPQTVVH